MPKKRLAELVTARFYKWRLKRRDQMYAADGRSNNPPLGRHSLDTDDYDAAIEALTKLDLLCAIKQGKTSPQQVVNQPRLLPLAEGSQLYQNHVARPAILRGAKPKTLKRYRPVFDKFVKFAKSEGIQFWNDVTAKVLGAYTAFLDEEGYAYGTEYLELTTLKSAAKWFVESELLPTQCLIRLRLSKPTGTSTYCWQAEEVAAMIALCQGNPELMWLYFVIVALASTGLRISELASLRWNDIDFKDNQIRIKDETALTHKKKSNDQVRQTKTGRGRALPIFPDLRAALEKIPRHRDGFVFHGPRGGILKPDTVRRLLIREVLTPLSKRFPKPAGEIIGFADGRLHSFRHYFAACVLAALAKSSR